LPDFLPTPYWWNSPTLNQTGELNAPHWFTHSQVKFLVKNLTVGLAEISVRDAPVRNRAANAVDELAHGGFALGGVLLAVKIFRDHHLRREQRPRLRAPRRFLLENDLAGVVRDFGGAPLPFDLVERLDFGVAENAFDQCDFRAVIGAATTYSPR
jgi:hypothetical protein